MYIVSRLKVQSVRVNIRRQVMANVCRKDEKDPEKS